MKKVFLSIFLLLSIVSVSFGQEFSKSYTVALNDLTKPCESVAGFGGLYYWRMQWTLQTPNTISGATLSLMGYNTNNCSDTGTEIVAATAATTNGTSAVSQGAFPYVRVVPASFAGTGTISIWVGGSRGNASSGGVAGAVDIDSVGGTPVTTTVPVSCGDCSGTGVSHIDDAAFTPAVTDIVPAGGFFDDVAPDSVNEGDSGVIRMSANRNLYSTIRDAAGNERGVNVSAGNALLVDASATTQPVSGTVTVTDGAGALNVIVDSGTITTVSTVTAVTTITNPVTVTDGAGALNVIIDSTTALTPGTAAGNLGKAEDAVAGSGDTGIAMLAQAQATPTNTAADNDYITIKTDANGVLWNHLAAGTNIAGKFGIDQTTPGTTNAVVPVDTSGNSLAVTDPCDGNNKTSVSFSISSATTTEFVNASASNYIYICSIDIVVGAANNVALVEDDTDTCGSPSAGMAGGVTAATGWNFAANGGLTKGNGGSTVFKSAATNRYGCLMTSTTAQTSGSIQFVLAP